MKNSVRDFRAVKGWTQEELGRRLGVSRQAINAIETERHDPSLGLAFHIAALFGEDVERVFDNPHRRKR